MSPDLFALYGELIMRAIREMEGVKIGGMNINNVRYADDTVLIADTKEKLQDLLETVRRASEEEGLNINADKTKTLVVSKEKRRTKMPPKSKRCHHRTSRFLLLLG